MWKQSMLKKVLMAFGLLLFCASPSLAADSVASPGYLQVVEKQAQQGNAIAEFNLGVLYHNGQGVPRDYQQAAAWLRKSADQGNADAALNLYILYHGGQGVPQDDQQAAQWCQRAAAQGNANAELILSTLYRKGQGVPRDDKQAAKWLNLSINNSIHPSLLQETTLKSAVSSSKTLFEVLSLAVVFVILAGLLGLNLFKRKSS